VDLTTLAANRLQDQPDDVPLRAALEFDDPLLTALGRTSREQVVTRRDSVATTLQSLEMTNGTTLDTALKQGAQGWVDREGKNPDALIGSVFLSAFGREPSAEEKRFAAELVGSPATAEGVQDFLWVVTMLPEFQLID
jgi:hypothetical protein